MRSAKILSLALVVGISAISCVVPRHARSRVEENDTAVYAAVLDSLFASKLGGGPVLGIAVSDSTLYDHRMGESGYVGDFRRVLRVDSSAIANWVTRTSVPHFLGYLSLLKTRVPVVVANSNQTHGLPRDPEKFWTGFAELFPKTRGLIQLSPVGYDNSGTLGILTLSFGCGTLCGNGYEIVVQKRNDGWHVETIRGTWVS